MLLDVFYRASSMSLVMKKSQSTMEDALQRAAARLAGGGERSDARENSEAERRS